MFIEIVGEPIRFQLYGKWSIVEDQRYGEVGLRLMNEMWKVVKDAKVLVYRDVNLGQILLVPFSFWPLDLPHRM